MCFNRAEGAEQFPHNRRNGRRDPAAENRMLWVQRAFGEDQVGIKSRHTRGEGEGTNQRNSTSTQDPHACFLYSQSRLLTGLQGEGCLR